MSQTNELIPLSESTYYILLSLTSPIHGYGIMNKVKKLTNNRLIIGPGTLYGALNILTKRRWIELLPSNPGDRRKMYIITNTGKKFLKIELLRLKELYYHGLEIEKEGLLND